MNAPYRHLPLTPDERLENAAYDAGYILVRDRSGYVIRKGTRTVGQTSGPNARLAMKCFMRDQLRIPA